MGFNLNRAMAGAGAAVADAGLLALRNELEQRRDQARMEWQSRENTITRKHASAEAEKTRGHQAEQARLTRQHASSEAEKTRGHQAEQGRLSRQHATSEGEATRSLQRDLARQREGAASARHKQSIDLQMATLKAQKEKVSLVPQADGRILKMKQDGTAAGYVTGPDGKEIVGPKNVGETAKLIIDGNNKYIAALTQDLKTAVDEEEKSAIRSAIDNAHQQNQRLLGLVSGKQPAKDASPGATNVGASGVDWSQFLGTSSGGGRPGQIVRGLIERRQ